MIWKFSQFSRIDLLIRDLLSALCVHNRFLNANFDAKLKKKQTLYYKHLYKDGFPLSHERTKKIQPINEVICSNITLLLNEGI
jgi:hypothetical protein